jgi:hypothetical protein
LVYVVDKMAIHNAEMAQKDEITVLMILLFMIPYWKQ